MKIVHWKTAHFDRLVRTNSNIGPIRGIDVFVKEIARLRADVIVSNR